MSFAPGELTEDSFLGGRLTIAQPRNGYRAGVDPVLLAASVPAEPGQSVLELGCGAGVAVLSLGQRVPGLRLTGVELQGEYAELARANAETNAIPLTVLTADLRRLPPALRAQTFDHVIANPPYFLRSRGTTSDDPGRDMALAGDTPLSEWIATATPRLAPGGYLTLIQKADRLGDILSAFDNRLGSIAILPLAPRIGRTTELVLVQARKGGRAALRLLAPLILHEGARHERDGEGYTDQARAIFRDGSALTLRS